MKLEMLERKLAKVAKMMNRNLDLKAYGRKYRVEENESGFFTLGWLPAQELWDRLDFVETALSKVNIEPPLFPVN